MREDFESGADGETMMTRQRRNEQTICMICLKKPATELVGDGSKRCADCATKIFQPDYGAFVD